MFFNEESCQQFYDGLLALELENSSGFEAVIFNILFVIMLWQATWSCFEISGLILMGCSDVGMITHMILGSSSLTTSQIKSITIIISFVVLVNAYYCSIKFFLPLYCVWWILMLSFFLFSLCDFVIKYPFISSGFRLVEI